MYQIKRNHLVEDLQIEDNGKTLTINVDINVDNILQQYNKAQYRIAQAAQAAQKAANDKDMENIEVAMGEAVLGLFEVVFGHEQTQKIVEFYDNKALEMLTDISPFITDVVAPKIQEAQKRIEESYRQVSKRGK